MEKAHPRIQLEKWTSKFTLEWFKEHVEIGLEGSPVRSIVDLCRIDEVRKYLSPLGRKVMVDIILWSTEFPKHPWLTKTGGVPHREAKLPWPKGKDGNPYTFVAQFCFIDSVDIVPKQLKGDLLLVFFKDPRSYVCENDDIYLEWSKIVLNEPIVASSCPQDVFLVPQYSGVLCRFPEYPENDDTFYDAQCKEPYHFAATESTKIGTEAFFIQDDPRTKELQLLCCLDAFHPSDEWPFVNISHVSKLKDGYDQIAKPSKNNRFEVEWQPFELLFPGSCLYILVKNSGEVTWTHGIN